MIIKNGKEISEYYYGKTPLIEMYRGKTLIWQSVHSAFGSGYWDNFKPWNNNEGWKNK